jgi:hypothetical protein
MGADAMTNRQVLLLIAAFLALTIGSFVYYIATWNPAERSSDHVDAPAFILANKLPPEAPAPSKGRIL